MKKPFFLLIFLVLFSSCAPISKPTPTLPPKKTLTTGHTSTPIPTPTRDPHGDPDGDTYPTSFEEIWGTDPFTFTTFEKLSVHPGTIYAKMRISQPFDIEDMNGTLYQVAREIEIDRGNTPDDTSDDYLIFEAVLFPYAKFPNYQLNKNVNSYPISQDQYPEGFSEFLNPYIYSDISDELISTVQNVIGKSNSVQEAIQKVINWNRQNIGIHSPSKGFLYYSEILKFKSSKMILNRETWYSTTRATLLNSQMRALGIPCKIIHTVYVTDDSNYEGIYHHPLNIVYINGFWVLLDYETGLNFKGSLNHHLDSGYQVVTDAYNDSSEVNWDIWIDVIDNWRGSEDFPERAWLLHKPLVLRINE